MKRIFLFLLGIIFSLHALDESSERASSSSGTEAGKQTSRPRRGALHNPPELASSSSSNPSTLSETIKSHITARNALVLERGGLVAEYGNLSNQYYNKKKGLFEDLFNKEKKSTEEKKTFISEQRSILKNLVENLQKMQAVLRAIRDQLKIQQDNLLRNKIEKLEKDLLELSEKHVPIDNKIEGYEKIFNLVTKYAKKICGLIDEDLAILIDNQNKNTPPSIKNK